MSSEPRIYFDACCFIDMVSHHLSIGVRQERAEHVYYCRKFLEASRGNEARVYTSSLTVAECVTVKDESDPNNFVAVMTEDVRRLFEGMLLSAKSGVMPVLPTPRIVKAARDLRWEHGATFSPLDSVHIATALEMRCSYFITTDAKLKKKNIEISKRLGLLITTADSLVSILPAKYRQLPLITTQVRAPASPV